MDVSRSEVTSIKLSMHLDKDSHDAGIRQTVFLHRVLVIYHLCFIKLSNCN